MNRHLRYLEFAKSVSEFSDYHQHHIGAVLVLRNRVVSVGWNTNKSHPLQAEYNRYRNLNGDNVVHKAHAETICLNRASKLDIDFGNSILYIFRQWKTGEWALSRPCSGCMQMIDDFEIGQIVYTTYGGYAVEYRGEK